MAEDTINVIYDAATYMGPIVIDDGQYTTPATQLHAYWISQGSPDSATVENQYSIGTTPSATDVVGWTSTGTDTEVTQTGLSLTHEQIYYFNAKSKNSAGVWSRINSSDGIIVNAHLPVINSITPSGSETKTARRRK